MGYFWALITFFNNLIDVFKELLNQFYLWKERKRLDREAKREAAVDCQKNAKTEEEFDKCQTDIVNNPP